MDNDKCNLDQGVNASQRDLVEGEVGSNDIALIYSTYPSTETAIAAGNFLVEAGLAACVNILSGMTSIYIWDGVLRRDDEVVMIVKTRVELTVRIIDELKRHHSYINPALMVVPVISGSSTYLDWLRQNTMAPRS